ncbi:hypothetical protein BGZ91_005939, partial [Linnemannia elongata]
MQAAIMSFSSSQDNSSSYSPASSSAPPRHPEIIVDGHRVLSQLQNIATLESVSSKSGDVQPIAQGLAAIQLGPVNLLSPLGHAAADDVHGPDYAGDARSLSSGYSSKFGFRKRLSRLFKGEKKVFKATSVSQTSSTSPTVSVVQLQLSPAASGTLCLGIFLENIIKPTFKAVLPKLHTRVDKTPQLVYCCNVLSKAQKPLPQTSDSDFSQDSPLDDEEKEWVQHIDPVLQGRYRWLVEQLVRAFADDPLKASDVVTEIVVIAPVLDRDTYRSLLSCFISKFEQTTALDVTLLQGLVQLVECASSGYLVDDDLVRIATVLSKELSTTHIGTSNHLLHLTLSLARVLDVMVAGNAKDLN